MMMRKKKRVDDVNCMPEACSIKNYINQDSIPYSLFFQYSAFVLSLSTITMPQQRGATTSLSKRGQIVGLANLQGNQRLRLSEIAIATNIPISTCSDIIRLSIPRIPLTTISDPCSEENLRPKPTALKGHNQALSLEEKERIITLALQDATHCRKPLHELISELGLNICSNTLSNILSSDGIHRCRPTQKPFLSANAKAARLTWATQYLHFDFRKVLFTDESLFESSTLRSAHAKGVLRRAGEEYLPQNLDRRFPKGLGAMFWGGIMYGYTGSQLPSHFFPTPVETSAQKRAAIINLEREFAMDTEDYNYFMDLGEPHTIPVVKTRSTKRKGGIDWYIYREQILQPKIFPFLFAQMTQRQELLYFLEDGAPSHTKDYNRAESLDNGFERISLPPSSPDLNPIELVWSFIKSRVKTRIGWNYRDAAIREIVVDEWQHLSLEFINTLILSMPNRLAAVIAAEGGNNFHG